MRLTIFLTLLLLILLPAELFPASVPRFATARIPTPVFSAQDIPGIFGKNRTRSLRLDKCGQMRDLEFVALPGTAFDILEVMPSDAAPIYRVTTADYPTKKNCFIDSRFVELHQERPPERPKIIPQKLEIIRSLLQAEGTRYVWGSNISRGIPELPLFYPPPEGSSPELLARWKLEGVDCSGLLYQATAGATPRNTSDLVRYGTGLRIAGLSVEEIGRKLMPLDLIVWSGHVIIVLDELRVIESRLECGSPTGVVISSLGETLQRIMKHRQPVDAYDNNVGKGREKFVIRRWYPGQ